MRDNRAKWGGGIWKFSRRSSELLRKGGGGRFSSIDESPNSPVPKGNSVQEFKPCRVPGSERPHFFLEDDVRQTIVECHIMNDGRHHPIHYVSNENPKLFIIQDVSLS